MHEKKSIRHAFPWMLMLLGIGDAIYMSFAYYYGPGIMPEFCREAFAAMRNSGFSTLLGVPVAILGAAWYLAIALSYGSRKSWPLGMFCAEMLAFIGMAYSAYLMVFSIWLIRKVCVFGAASMVLMILIFSTLLVKDLKGKEPLRLHMC